MVAISLAAERLSLLWKTLLWRWGRGGFQSLQLNICSHSQLVWGESGKKLPIDGMSVFKDLLF